MTLTDSAKLSFDTENETENETEIEMGLYCRTFRPRETMTCEDHYLRTLTSSATNVLGHRVVNWWKPVLLYCLFRLDWRQLLKSRVNTSWLCSGVNTTWWKECHGMGQPVIIGNRNLTAQHYISDILHPTGLPFLQQQPRDFIQHNNVRIVQNFLEANKEGRKCFI